MRSCTTLNALWSFQWKFFGSGMDRSHHRHQSHWRHDATIWTRVDTLVIISNPLDSEVGTPSVLLALVLISVCFFVLYLSVFVFVCIWNVALPFIRLLHMVSRLNMIFSAASTTTKKKNKKESVQSCQARVSDSFETVFTSMLVHVQFSRFVCLWFCVCVRLMYSIKIEHESGITLPARAKWASHIENETNFGVYECCCCCRCCYCVFSQIQLKILFTDFPKRC